MITYANKTSGFTLIELLVYIAISSILILSLVTYIVLVIKLEKRSAIRNTVAEEVVHVEATLRHTLRSASAIVSPSPGSTDNSLRVTMKEEVKGEAEFVNEADTITLEDAIQSALPLTSGQVRIIESTFSNVSRLDTSGSIDYTFTYEWDDEEGITQLGSSNGTISVR